MHTQRLKPQETPESERAFLAGRVAGWQDAVEGLRKDPLRCRDKRTGEVSRTRALNCGAMFRDGYIMGYHEGGAWDSLKSEIGETAKSQVKPCPSCQSLRIDWDACWNCGEKANLPAAP